MYNKKSPKPEEGLVIMEKNKVIWNYWIPEICSTCKWNVNHVRDSILCICKYPYKNAGDICMHDEKNDRDNFTNEINGWKLL